MLALALLAACGGPDRRQADYCLALLPALTDGAADLTEVRTAAGGRPHEVVVHYHRGSGADDGGEQTVSCLFAGDATSADRFRLLAVQAESGQTLSEVQLAILRIWVERLRGVTEARHTRPSPGLYFLQTLVNALSVCCLYALLSLGYSLVFGVIERFNLAFGELAMLGGMTAGLLVGAQTTAFGWSLVAALPIATLGALACGGLYGWAANRMAVQSLRDGSGHGVMIATIGLSIALQEGVRLLHGAREVWLPILLPQRFALAGEGDWVVWLGAQPLAVAGLALAVFGVLQIVMSRTTVGLRLRAVADDPAMARLLGIDNARVIATAFALGGVAAGAAGVILSLHYGGLNFFTGVQVGFKALVAAIVGGVGSLPGAVLGGILIGLVETFWSGYLDGTWRDVAVFALLALFLIFRPQGLLGRRRDPLG
mgnify:CR=1 FL=1